MRERYWDELDNLWENDYTKSCAAVATKVQSITVFASSQAKLKGVDQKAKLRHKTKWWSEMQHR